MCRTPPDCHRGSRPCQASAYAQGPCPFYDERLGNVGFPAKNSGQWHEPSRGRRGHRHRPISVVGPGEWALGVCSSVHIGNGVPVASKNWVLRPLSNGEFRGTHTGRRVLGRGGGGLRAQGLWTKNGPKNRFPLQNVILRPRHCSSRTQGVLRTGGVGADPPLAHPHASHAGP